MNTQYWVVPAAAQATLAQVQAQMMPATQAVQTVSKAYVDEAITELNESLLTASGGTLSGPLDLNADPTQAMQASTKHYVDTQVATAVPLAGGNMTGARTTPAGVYGLPITRRRQNRGGLYQSPEGLPLAEPLSILRLRAAHECFRSDRLEHAGPLRIRRPVVLAAQ